MSSQSTSAIIWLRMIKIAQKITRAAEEPLREANITAPQMQILARLYRENGQIQQTLAENLHVTKGNISQLIEKLEMNGLVDRRKEGRKTRVFLTEAGLKVIEQLLPSHDAFIEKNFSSLTEEEKTQLLFLLSKLDKGIN
ncbi:MarR family transcriptional regulator [Metabacillus indicus]|uniref:MarR family winged helix-turn-helix transcriptional regulator n=1 Tax=Metabacillus indicus TaxID=246786 RepID=UPI00317B8CC9